MGDIVNLKDLQEYFENNNIINFKLYSMNYIINQKEGFIEAYAELYPERKEKFKSFKEAMNNFKVYNEAIINQIDKIDLIEKDNK